MLKINSNFIEGVIFDMDGLMFDTEKVYTLTWPIAAREFGYTVTEEQIIGAVGLNAEAGRKYFEGLFGEDFPFYPIRIRRLEIAHDYIEKNGLPAKPGLYELLDFLSKNDIPMAIATSSERSKAEWYLELSALRDTFDAVICGDDVIKSKPDPQIFNTAAQRLGANPENCIILEDSLSGSEAAIATGGYAIMIPDYKEPTYELRKNLFSVLSNLNKVIEIFDKQGNI